MVSTETQSILQRKAAAGTKDQVARTMSVAKAMRLTIAKIGKEMFDMPLSVIGAVTQDCNAADLSELTDDAALLCLLEDDGQVGAAVIGTEIVGGLIQQQTMGRIGPSNGDTRPMTQTDAIMCAPLLDSLFKRVKPMLEIKAEQDVVTDFSFGARFEDARAMAMALDQPEYFVVRLTLDLAGGVRQGDLALVLPKTRAVKTEQVNGDQSEGTGVSETPKLDNVVMALPAELMIVLCKLTLELAQVEQWAIGDVVNLPQNSFSDTEIFTKTGVKIGSGKLGQVDGLRALRLRRDPIYATQPRRREGDLADLDLPEIEELPRNESKNLQIEAAPNSEDLVIDSGDGLPPLRHSKGTSEHEDSIEANEHEDSSEKPHESRSQEVALPELSDFPDLADLAQLPQAGANA